MESTVEWVSDEEATELNLRGIEADAERCNFCGKNFPSHNSFTAHLRWHPVEIDNMIFDVINRSTKPIRLSTIQKLANVNFSVNHAVQRLVREGKVYRSGYKFTTRTRTRKAAAPSITTPPPVVTAPVVPTPAPVQETPVKITNAISEDQMNKLIVLTLKRTKPETYNSVVNEIVENMIRYAVGIAELS